MVDMSVDIGIFRGKESGMLRGMFIKAKFKGIERGTFIKDIGNEEMVIGRGMIRDVDTDLERGGGDVSGEEQLEVVEESWEEVAPGVVVVEATS